MAKSIRGRDENAVTIYIGVNEKQRVFFILNGPGVNKSLMLICSCLSYTQSSNN